MGNYTADNMHPLTLAFLGDARYAVCIRKHLIEAEPYLKPDQLHRKANKLVSARAQSEALLYLKREGFLNDREWHIAKRARNKSSATRAKNATIKEYRNASGLEALIGYLDLTEDRGRMGTLMEEIARMRRGDSE